MSPMQRSLARMKKLGYMCAIVEHFNSFVKIRQDLFGCIDVLCVNDVDTIGLQVCGSAGDPAKHVTKVTTDPKVSERLKKWLRNYDRSYQIQGWRKVGLRGKRKLWRPRIIHIELTRNWDKFVVTEEETADE